MLLQSLLSSFTLAKSCPTSALVTGDESAVTAAVVQTLAERGVTTQPVLGCAAVKVTIDRVGNSFRVQLVDSDGRIVNRTAGHLEGIATLIESWSRDDLSRPLWDRRNTADTTDGNGIVRASDTEVPTAFTPKPAAPRLVDEVAVTGATAIASDGSVWFAVDAAACRKWGRTCTGGGLRYSKDAGIRGASAEANASRSGLDFWAKVDIPLAFEAFRLSPGLALGPGWLHTRQGSPANAVASGEAIGDSYGVRANAHVYMSLPITQGISLLWGIEAETAWFNRADEFAPGTNIPIVRAPNLFLRSGLGLRYEVL